MAVPAQALDRTGIGDNAKEDVSQIISNISPTECPFSTIVAQGTATNDVHEWLIDSLDPARSDNKHVDGDDFSAEGDTGQVGTGFDGIAISVAERSGNYCQISRKDIVVTKRADAVNKHGQDDAGAYQIGLAAAALKRDIESSSVANNNAVLGTTTVAGQAASYCAWMRNNSSRGTGGSDPATLVNGFPTGTAATDGTTRALSEEDLLDVIGDCYIEGGNITHVMMHPTVKQKFSQYMFDATSGNGRIATAFQDHGKNPSVGATALGAVDVWVSDFGVIDIAPNRFQRSRDVLVIDKDQWSQDFLIPYDIQQLGDTGPSRKFILSADWTLKASNPDSSGIVADVDSSAAMVFASTEA